MDAQQLGQSATGAAFGLVSGSGLSRHLLQQLLSGSGYQLACCCDAAALAADNGGPAAWERAHGLQAWLVDGGDPQHADAFECLVEHSQLPVLLCEDMPPAQTAPEYGPWARRLVEKLEDVATSASGNIDVWPEAQPVWMLAASYGGPEMVRRFVGALAADLPVALVYGQHIDNNFDAILSDALASKHGYPARLIESHGQLQVGTVSVIPVAQQLRFLPRGRVQVTGTGWPGPYQPSLDQVIAELARIYRDKLGVIIFSGMCNDGEIGCRVARAAGAEVWAQSPDSCLSADMPNAALATGCVSQQGTPEQLASMLSQRLAADP